MRQRTPRLLMLPLLALLLAALAPLTAQPVSAHPQRSAQTSDASVAFPTVDPAYIYQQLSAVATRFQRREAGYDNNLPVAQNGHDEFAAYWQAEMLNNLQGFGATAKHDTFSVAGWSTRPASVNAFNVEVTVPGVSHAEQVVVIGCHYDGEASSTQSANDDASGCAIELGVAKALGEYWRANHLYPARTLRFVIYDAEEQGIYGSFHYLNQTINGDLGNVVAMINEEQSGIGYPLRYLGKMSNPLLPTTLMMTPLTDNQSYNNTSSFTAAQVQTITAFRTLEQQAAPAAFAAFRALGYTSLTYRDDQNKPVTQQIFTQQDLSNAPQADDNIGGSDNYPFALAGLPTATYIGNYSYYDRNPPPWSYPYDQPQDTIQLMNVYASGSAAESQALELALALPGMLTTWTLTQPAVLGFVAADGKPLAAIGDISVTKPGQSVALDASASYDPANPTAALSYHWNFGDGAQADGATTQHTWASAGDFPLTLTVSDTMGARTISKTVHITTTPPVIVDPYAAYPAQDGVPPANPAMTLPKPDANAGSSSGANPGANHPSGSPASAGAPWWLWLLLGLVIVAAGSLIGFGMRRRQPALATNAPPTQDELDHQERLAAVRNLLTLNAPDAQRNEPRDPGVWAPPPQE